MDNKPTPPPTKTQQTTTALKGIASRPHPRLELVLLIVLGYVLGRL